MEQHHPEPQPPTTLPVLSDVEGPTTRHDGWTGEKMAIFCESLAETAVVAEACEAACMGISGAYAARRRDPIFAAAWDAALSIARERLADTLLARSMEGNVEQLYRDGELVGERHPSTGRSPLTPCALTTGKASRRRWPCSRAPVSLSQGDSFDPEQDQSDRCWWDECDGCWMTDFPPPPGFDGYETRGYDDHEEAQDEPYRRECTPEEVAILEADRARAHGAVREEDEDRRDAWFALLKADAEEIEGTADDASTGNAVGER
jgi:hypothetical protein